jgi:branched-chain amino acid transport system permease protein
MVYGILRMINFAHGEIFMAGTFAGYFMPSAWPDGILDAGPLAGLRSSRHL